MKYTTRKLSFPHTPATQILKLNDFFAERVFNYWPGRPSGKSFNRNWRSVPAQKVWGFGYTISDLQFHAVYFIDFPTKAHFDRITAWLAYCPDQLGCCQYIQSLRHIVPVQSCLLCNFGQVTPPTPPPPHIPCQELNSFRQEIIFLPVGGKWVQKRISFCVIYFIDILLM